MMVWKPFDSPLPVGTGGVLGPIFPWMAPMPNPAISALRKPGTPPFCPGLLVIKIRS